MSAEPIQPDGSNFRAPQGEQVGPNGRPDLRVIDGTFTENPNPTPEAARPTVDAQSVRETGRFATWAAGLRDMRESASTYEAADAGAEATRKQKVAAWLAPGAARAEAGRGKFMDRLRSWGRSAKESVVQTAVDAAVLGREVSKLAMPAFYATVESGKKMGRNIADSAVAYGHEVAANAVEIAANTSNNIENVAGMHTNFSEWRVKRNTKAFDRRFAKTVERRSAVEEHEAKGQYFRAGYQKLRGRLPAFLADRANRKIAKNTDKANARMVTQLEWEDQTDHYAGIVDQHRAAADARYQAKAARRRK